jgi:tetratricopeptide (TPR) repeat protein
MPPKPARVALVLALPLLTACAVHTGPLDRGTAHYRAEQYRSALSAFDEAVRVEPREAASWNNRALARLRLGQTVGALGDLTKAIELSPADPDLYFNRGNVYMTLGNYDYAIQDYNRAVVLEPNHTKAYFNRGVARLRRGDAGGAEVDWRYAIALEPDPATQASMMRTAGLPPLANGPSMATAPPPPAVPPDSPAAMPTLGDPAPTPEGDDARELTLRGVSRALDGDRQGAIGDLREAVMKERDPRRRAMIERLLSDVEGVR